MFLNTIISQTAYSVLSLDKGHWLWWKFYGQRVYGNKKFKIYNKKFKCQKTNDKLKKVCNVSHRKKINILKNKELLKTEKKKQWKYRLEKWTKIAQKTQTAVKNKRRYSYLFIVRNTN